jgi:hypothetical protein
MVMHGSSLFVSRRLDRNIRRVSPKIPATDAEVRSATPSVWAGRHPGNRQTMLNITKKGLIWELLLPGPAGTMAHTAGYGRHDGSSFRLEIPTGSQYLEFVCQLVRVRPGTRHPARTAPDRGAACRCGGLPYTGIHRRARIHRATNSSDEAENGPGGVVGTCTPSRATDRITRRIMTVTIHHVAAPHEPGNGAR